MLTQKATEANKSLKSKIKSKLKRMATVFC